MEGKASETPHMKMQMRVNLVRWPRYIGRFFAYGLWCLVGNAEMYVVRLGLGTPKQWFLSRWGHWRYLEALLVVIAKEENANGVW